MDLERALHRHGVLSDDQVGLPGSRQVVGYERALVVREAPRRSVSVHAAAGRLMSEPCMLAALVETGFLATFPADCGPVWATELGTAVRLPDGIEEDTGTHGRRRPAGGRPGLAGVRRSPGSDREGRARYGLDDFDLQALEDLVLHLPVDRSGMPVGMTLLAARDLVGPDWGPLLSAVLGGKASSVVRTAHRHGPDALYVGPDDVARIGSPEMTGMSPAVALHMLGIPPRIGSERDCCLASLFARAGVPAGDGAGFRQMT